ncbi:MAG: trimethylamine methyltransferase family protein, partial [Desulfobacterales bacterium]|nr:trimethylamine methyltransferase family protein [Desulfobacterales bacterium]
NLTRLTQAIDTINMAGGLPVDPCDADPGRKCFEMLHRILRHSDKPVWAFSSPKADIFKMFEMVRMAFGGGNDLFDHHVVAAPVCPLSPLKYSRTSAETLIAYARYGQPLYINSCILAGVSGPISLLGTATLMNTEILAGLVLVQLIRPGTPVVYVPGSTVADMQSGAYVCGSPESNLITTAGLQMALDRYKLPTRVMGGLSDAKCLDYQSGAETMQNLFMPLMAGAHYLNNSLGNMDGQMVTSYEKFILDVESVERVLRVMQGIDGNDRDLSVDLIQQEAHAGNYLMNPSTFTRFKDRWRPSLTKWQSYSQWEAEGAPDACTRATQKYREILAESPQSMISPGLDRDLRHFVREVEPEG